MASEIKLPELGENVTEGAVLDIKVAPGDTVSQGQTLLEVEAEKATVEVPSPTAGRVTQLLVKKGDTIHVGQALCQIEAVDGAKEAKPKVAPAETAPVGKPAPVPVKRAEESGRSVETQEHAPPTLTRETAGGRAEAPAERKAVTKDGAVPPQKLVAAGPATRRLARELGVDLKGVHGSGPGGRITQDDVKAYVRQLASGARQPGVGVHVPSLPDFSRWGEIERRPLDAVRRKTAEQMSLAWSLIPHVTHHDQADVTELDTFRRQQEGRGPKPTVTAFALKAAAIALRQFPQFGASLDLPNNQLIVKRYCHIGVAVDTDRGLLVPVLRDVDKKSIEALAKELAETAERARQKKLQPDEMRGGVFTITNLGGIGGTGFSPIVNYPEVAILGLSRSQLQPVVRRASGREPDVVTRLILPLSVSYDHRVIDGADAARFTRRIAELLESPLLMLLHA
jgi:pyruvate dehydrogenase E2 component (dihydrolipoamide acetyltransferase)